MVSRCVVIAGLLAILNCIEIALAQAQSPAARSITIGEKVFVGAVLPDTRIRFIVGEGQLRFTSTDVQFAKAEAFFTGGSPTLATRRVNLGTLCRLRSGSAAHPHRFPLGLAQPG